MNLPKRTLRYQHGVTLLEVLVAVVVLSFGLLGVAGLQVGSLKSTQSSYYRSIASSLASDIVDKLRANALSQATAGQATTANYYVATGAKTLDCTASACSAQVLANYEIDMWKTALAALLPSGNGVVCLDSTPYDGSSSTTPACDGAAGGQWVVKIWWDNSRAQLNQSDATASSTQRLVTIFAP